MLALLYLPRRAVEPEPASDEAAFNRRYVAALALGPFAVTTVIAAVLGRQPIAHVGLSAVVVPAARGADAVAAALEAAQLRDLPPPRWRC